MVKKEKIKSPLKNEGENMGDLENVITNNNSNSIPNIEELKIPIERGFYWNYKRVLFFNNHFGSDGFNREDVEKIASQVRKASSLSARLYQDQHILVKADKEKFYVYINDLGQVFLPEIGIDKSNRKIYGKTDNPKTIKRFRIIGDWYLKK
jgi:hypothetical protein